jgi:hypothetical protein
MARLIIGLVIGIVVGGALVYFLFVGVPQSTTRPGTPIQSPDSTGNPPGTAQLVLRQELLNESLSTIFRELKPPTFRLGSGFGGGCESTITILPNGSGVTTGVQFNENKLSVPLAFAGNYSSPIGCIPFSGWAQTNIELRFDRETQTVYAVLNVETVNLDGVNPLWNGLITPLVQSAINTQVNPIRIVDGRQLALNLPIVASGGGLTAGVNDVRAEIKDNALNLLVVYDLRAAPTTPQEQPQ